MSNTYRDKHRGRVHRGGQAMRKFQQRRAARNRQKAANLRSDAVASPASV